MRTCGGCAYCCEVAEVPELAKPALARCQYQTLLLLDGQCAIFRHPDRPAVCRSFACSWLRGFGEEGDRPDRIRAMFSINRTSSGGHVGFLYAKGASERVDELAASFARQTGLPLVVVDDPMGPGEHVVIRDDLTGLAAAMLGQEERRLAEDVAMYARREPD